MSAAYRQKLTLHDVWQAAQNDRHFDYIFWIHVILDILVETALRHFGYCLVLLACILIFCLISAGFLVVLPAITMKGSPWYYLHFLLGSCISFFVIFNYYKAVTTKPGTPSDYITEDFLGEHFCKKCNFPKPERSHHCSICNQCVMKMDHHCPWLSNCVGLRNYRFFICFLFWVTIGTFYLSLLCSPKVFVEDSILSPTVLAHKVRGYFFSSPAPTPIIPPHDEELLPLQDKTRYHHKEEKQYLRNRENVYSVIYDQYKQHKYLRNHPQENDEQSLQTDEGRRKLSHNHTTSYDEYFNTSNFNFFLPFMNNQKSQLKEVHQTDNTITYDMKHTLAGSINKEMKDQSKLVKRRLENDEISFTNNLSESSPTWNKFFMDEYVVFLAIFMIAIGISLATACLLCMHLYLVCTNQTTIELFQARLDMSRGRGYGSYENPYDKGLSRNFEEVMGTRWWHLAFLPTFRQVDPLIEEFKDRPDHPCYCLSCV